ncbi:hypothetical protein VF06_37805 [Nostoc linckia z4]|uniref:hypothetical protein n=1 Tax=Nostoc linckia TaxID=92942 RepID=UPI000BFFCFD7|nr:hypothetical protein [Nostoc linckia]PHJ51081.1 hypothetical protein VF02_38020 [Nostoc linckia z1]PHJ59312.1 hypothetical protein VF05_32495 [Nostoc linckia z3]PHJ63637.1 hypothetical protein VF03_30005 [Nostoc linckia z2]PHJ70004.1 hypothetical protein VF06_37805 [Nostoc linckia z4]
MRLITEAHLTVLNELLKEVSSKHHSVKSDEEHYKIDGQIEALYHAMHNLQFGHKYFEKLPDNERHWFDAECEKCGWFGSSEYLMGGGAIADTGDYDDCRCPVCNSLSVN